MSKRTRRGPGLAGGWALNFIKKQQKRNRRELGGSFQPQSKKKQKKSNTDDSKLFCRTKTLMKLTYNRKINDIKFSKGDFFLGTIKDKNLVCESPISCKMSLTKLEPVEIYDISNEIPKEIERACAGHTKRTLPTILKDLILDFARIPGRTAVQQFVMHPVLPLAVVTSLRSSSVELCKVTQNFSI
eukprot:UN30258